MAGSQVVLVVLQIEIAQDNIDGNHQQTAVHHLRRVAAVRRTNVENVTAEVGSGKARVLLQVGSQFADDTCEVELRIALVLNLRNLRQRLGEEGHLAVVARQLQVSPGADGLDTSILVDDNVGGTSIESGIAMGDIIVTVIDDTVVGIGRIVAVGRRSREVGQTAQHTVSVLRGLHQVATHLTLEHILVSNLLHGLKNAIGIEERVCLLVQCRVEHLMVAVGLEHIGARA